MTTVSLIGDSQAEGLNLGGLDAKLRAVGWAPSRWWFRAGSGSSGLASEVGNIASPRPDVVIVAAGGNDSPTSTAAWGSLREAIRGIGATRIYWMGPPGAPTNPELDATRRLISEAQRSFFSSKPDVTWIDGRALAAGLPRRDDVHLTPDGYRELAQRLANRVGGSSSPSALVTVGLAAAALWGGWKLAERWADKPARKWAASYRRKARKRR